MIFCSRFDALKAQSVCGSCLLSIMGDKNESGLETFANESSACDVNGIESFNYGGHRKASAFHNGGSQSDPGEDALQTPEFCACRCDVVVIPVMLQPHSVNKAAALNSHDGAAICFLPMTPAFPCILLAPKDPENDTRVNVKVHRSARISAKTRSTSTFLRSFRGLIFLASDGGSMASSIMTSSSCACLIDVNRAIGVERSQMITVSPLRTAARCALKFAFSSAIFTSFMTNCGHIWSTMSISTSAEQHTARNHVTDFATDCRHDCNKGNNDAYFETRSRYDS